MTNAKSVKINLKFSCGDVFDLIKLGVSIPTIRILLVAKFPTNNTKLKEKDIEIIELIKKLKFHAVYSTIFK